MRQPGSKDCSRCKGSIGPRTPSAHNVEGFYLMFLWPKHLPYKLYIVQEVQMESSQREVATCWRIVQCTLPASNPSHHTITITGVLCILLCNAAVCFDIGKIIKTVWLPDQWQTYLIGPTVDLSWSKIVLITKDLEGQQEMIRH